MPFDAQARYRPPAGMWKLGPLPACILLALCARAAAQTCPTPPVANNTQCTVAPGSTVSVAANGTGLGATNTGELTADGITVNLTGANATGAFAQAGGTISFDGSDLRTTSTAAAASGQSGLRAVGAGSQVEAIGSTIVMAPGGTSTPANLRGASAENGGVIVLTNTTVQVTGGGNAANNYGVVALGNGSALRMSGGSVSTSSRGAFGALAQDGGTLTLDGARISTAGLQNTTTLDGSHAIVARGSGSSVSGSRLVVESSGTLANLVRVDDHGSVILADSQLSSTGSGNVANAAAALRVTSGGQLRVGGTAIATTGALYSPGLSIDGAGSAAWIEDTSISVGGARSFGVLARDGAAVTLTNSTLLQSATTATGPWSPAVQAEGAGTLVTLSGGTIDTHSATVYGVRALSGARVDVDGTAITTRGVDAPAFSAAGDATINASDFTVTTHGNDNAMGALADLAGTVHLTGGTITTWGNQVRAASFAHALGARNPGGLLTAQGTVAHTHGTYAMGVWADDGGTANVQDVTVATEGFGATGVLAIVEQRGAAFPATVSYTGGSIETFGSQAHGANAQARNDLAGELASITLDHAPITTHGDDAVGLRAVLADYGGTPDGRGSAQVLASNLRVTTSGSGAHGALSRDNPTLVSMDQVELHPGGTAAHGAVALIGGHVVGNATTVAPTGADAMALFVIGTPTAVSEADFSGGSTLTPAHGPAVGVAGNGRIGLADTTVTAGDQWLRVGSLDDFPALVAGVAPVRAPGDLPDDDGNLPSDPGPLPMAAPIPVVPGEADITATRSTLTGSAFTAAGSTSHLTLVDSLWRMTGSSNLTTLVNDPSRIEFAPPLGDPRLPSSYKTLTVSSYGGDGTLALNTWLAADDSPSDRLVVLNGSSSGAGQVEIANTGGAGALTLGDGIRVVQAIDATTAIDNFSLAGRVVAGPYEYLLYRGGLGGRSSSADAANSWYLRSVIDCAAPGAPVPPCPTPPDPPAPPTPPPPPPTPPPPIPPEPVIPAYRQEVSLVAALPAMAAIYGRALLDTLHERVGEEELLRQRGDLRPDRQGVNAGWVRYVGYDGEHDGGRQGIYGTRGPDFDYRFDALQIGLDLYRHVDEEDDSRKHAGFYLAYGRGNGDVRHNLLDYRYHAGDDSFVARTVGGYWTGFNARGAYLDAVAQYSWYDLRVASLAMPDSFTNADGLALSLEGGWPFNLNEGDGHSIEDGRWRLEPQAQVIWQQVDMDDLDDATEHVRFSDGDSLVGRLGARLNRNGQHDNREGQLRSSNAWLRVNVWHEFRGEPRAEFAAQSGYVPFAVDLGGSWGEVGVGGTWQVSATGYLYGDIDYSWSFDGDERAWNGKLGMRWNW